jgi:flagellin-like protein
MKLLRVTRKRKAISGVFVALLLFAMVFTVGTNYFLFVNQANLATSQATAVRQDALLQGREENLAIGVSLSGGSTLVVSASNIGGVPTSISSIYLTDTSGKTMNPPGLMGQAQTNLTASQWPLTLNVGAKTSGNSGCLPGKPGCNIALSGYSYTSGNLFVKVVTGRGNVFSFGYPTLTNGGTGSNVLVVTMNAYPTPPLTQVFTCTGCITLLITVYNYASNPITGVAPSPNPPTPQLTGTAMVSGGSCGAANPSSTIPAYSGSGTAPSITFTCTWNAQTGSVGGFATFAGYAQGTLSGVTVTSALAVSNILQIGGSSNVGTQGAFSVNFFFFGTSSCVLNGNWVAPCVTNPAVFPHASVGALPDGAITKVGTNHYVAYYVTITNNYPAPLEILQYSFLQLDASHPPPVVGNETDLWLAGAASTYNSLGHYYPNYATNPNPPSLAPFAGNTVNCAESGPTWTPSPNCIDINYGQSMTLTFAACGFGASNWDWGGTQYGSKFDNTAGCTSSAPGFSPQGSADVLTVVLSFMYQGQVYTQAIQFQGLAVVP